MRDWAAVVLLVTLALVTAGAVDARIGAARLDARLAALEAQVAAAEDSRLTWASVAQEAHEIAEEHEQRCEWSLMPRADARAIEDAILVGCSRREPCRVAWSIGGAGP